MDKLSKMYSYINWPIVMFIVLLFVLFFDLKLWVALAIYIIIVLIDSAVMYIRKDTKKFKWNILFALVLVVLLFLFG